MKLGKVALLPLAAFAILSTTASAEDKKSPAIVMNEDVGVPVFPYDIEDKPYVIVAGIEAGVRKATIFSKEPSQKKIYNELWERAKKAGADAVVLASYGDSKVSALSWGRTGANGIAIRFLTEKDIADGVAAEKASSFDPAKHKNIK